MMNRYSRGLFISLIFFSLSTVLYAVSRDKFPINKIGYNPYHQNDVVASAFIFFLTGIVAESSIGIVRLDILDNLNKLKIKRSFR